MPSYMLRRLPAGLVARAKAKAREADTDLETVLTAFLESYAQHGSIASSGGHARKLALTPQQRTDIARKAAETRWKAARE